MKKPVYKYGVKITKPWSKEMYQHNEIVSETMKSNIKKAIDTAVKKEDDAKFVEIAKSVCYYGFGNPYITEENVGDTLRELDTMVNHQLNEEYPYLEKLGLVPELDVHLIGYEDTKELNALRADPELEASYNKVSVTPKLNKEDHDEAMRMQGAHL